VATPLGGKSSMTVRAPLRSIRSIMAVNPRLLGFHVGTVDASIGRDHDVASNPIPRSASTIDPVFRQCRRIAARYDKLAANYLAFAQLASTRLWLRANESTL
jgi:hypothetical protein